MQTKAPNNSSQEDCYLRYLAGLEGGVSPFLEKARGRSVLMTGLALPTLALLASPLVNPNRYSSIFVAYQTNDPLRIKLRLVIGSYFWNLADTVYQNPIKITTCVAAAVISCMVISSKLKKAPQDLNQRFFSMVTRLSACENANELAQQIIKRRAQIEEEFKTHQISNTIGESLFKTAEKIFQQEVKRYLDEQKLKGK